MDVRSTLCEDVVGDAGGLCIEFGRSRIVCDDRGCYESKGFGESCERVGLWWFFLKW